MRPHSQCEGIAFVGQVARWEVYRRRIVTVKVERRGWVFKTMKKGMQCSFRKKGIALRGNGREIMRYGDLEQEIWSQSDYWYRRSCRARRSTTDRAISLGVIRRGRRGIWKQVETLLKMKIFRTVATFRNQLNTWKKNGMTIGFVPTMGYLHQGHTSLVKLSKTKCDITVVSIFVNPTQFAPNEDFEKYPKNLARDLDMLSEIDTDVVFAPQTQEMYPFGIASLSPEHRKGAYIDILPREDRLESKCRTSHFSGVVTVVAKLLNIVVPNYIFFGQKDIEQCFKVRTLIRDLLFPTAMIIGPTVREGDGLAYSSRNKYLSPKGRSEAILLYKTLVYISSTVRKLKGSPGVCSEIIKEAAAHFLMSRRDKSSELEYLSISSVEDLSELDQIDSDSHAILLGAAKIDGIHLIDNMLFNCSLEDI